MSSNKIGTCANVLAHMIPPTPPKLTLSMQKSPLQQRRKDKRAKEQKQKQKKREALSFLVHAMFKCARVTQVTAIQQLVFYTAYYHRQQAI